MKNKDLRLTRLLWKNQTFSLKKFKKASCAHDAPPLDSRLFWRIIYGHLYHCRGKQVADDIDLPQSTTMSNKITSYCNTSSFFSTFIYYKPTDWQPDIDATTPRVMSINTLAIFLNFTIHLLCLTTVQAWKEVVSTSWLEIWTQILQLTVGIILM